MSTLTSNYFETDSRALSLTRTHPIRKPIREKRENAKQTIAHPHSLSIQNQQKKHIEAICDGYMFFNCNCRSTNHPSPRAIIRHFVVDPNAERKIA